mgnify:CR=1 FL=1
MKTAYIQEIEMIGDTSIERTPSESLIVELFEQAIVWNAKANRRHLHHGVNGPTCERPKVMIYG